MREYWWLLLTLFLVGCTAAADSLVGAAWPFSLAVAWLS
jgi:hypothetical protein